MTDNQILYTHISAILVSLLFLKITLKWNNVGRLLYFVLFFWAGYINAKTVLISPENYLNYQSYAVFDFYKTFIKEYFALHITPIVLSIAFCQLVIAVLLSMHGMAVKLGGIGGIIFLLAIIPLGVGSGFPTSLILAIGLIILTRKNFDKNLFLFIEDKVKRKRHEG